MKKLSRKTKRLLAFLLVEVVVAVNMFSVFAAEDEVQDVTTEVEAQEVTAQGSDSVETGEITYTEEQGERFTEVAEESAEETSDYTTTEGEVPSENPLGDAGEASTDKNIDQEPLGLMEEISEENVDGEEAADIEETEAESREYTETVEVDHTVKVYGTAVSEDTAIEGFENFSVVGGNIIDQYPQIEGYEFKSASYNGKDISKVGTNVTESTDTVKKLYYDEEAMEDVEADVLVTTKTYTSYLLAGEEKIELSENVTLTFEYVASESEKAEEETPEGTKDLKLSFTASYEDENGEALEGTESSAISFTDSYDLTNAPEIEDYEFAYALINGTKASSLNKETIDIDENAETEESDEAEDIEYTKEVVYSFTSLDGEKVKLESDTNVIFVYKSLFKEIELSFEVVDKKGEAIKGFETVEAPAFETELLLNDSEIAPIEIEDYTFVEATVDGEVITSIIKDEKHENVYFIVKGEGEEQTALEEDTTVTLVYTETQYVVELKGTIVDEFGDSIDDKYTDIELPKFDDELVLDDVENPPYDNVQIRKNLFKVIKYTYVKATYDGDVITSLKKTAVEAEADDADSKDGFAYEYSVDGGETWKKIKEDATITFEYSDGKKTTYTYEDAYVSVTATLQHANAIPDDAEFKVTAVTADTPGYDYEAYMAALNRNADTLGADSNSNGDAYNEDNTLLYDIAFLAPAIGEDGEEIEGSLIEYQPAEGMVNISMNFKKNQLEEDLQAQEASDVTVVHMPLVDSVKESVDTTADATNLSVADIKVEVVSDATSIKGESSDFTLSDFSVLGFVNGGELCASDKFPEDGYSLEYILNGFNIVSRGDASSSIHTMGGVIVGGKFSGTGSGFADSANITKPSYVYEVAYSGLGNSRSGQNPVADLFVGKNKVSSDGKGIWINGQENRGWGDGYNNKGLVYKNPDYIDIDRLFEVINADSQALPNQADATYSNVSGTITVQAGTTVNVNAGGNKFTVKITGSSDDATVINVLDSGTPGFPKIDVGYTPKEDGDNQPIVINFPNASNVYIDSDRTPLYGHVLAPNASITMSGGNYNGCLVGNTVTSNGEGHLWPYRGKKIVRPASYALKAEKKVDGRAATSSESGLFEFKLIQVSSDGTEKVVDTVKNNGSEVGFKQFGDVYDTGIYWYKIVESSATDGYTKDETVYYAEVTVTQQTSGRITNTNSDITYHVGSKNGSTVSVPSFNNTSIKYKKFKGIKFWDDNKDQDGVRPGSITITIYDDTNQTKAEVITVTGFDDTDSWSWESTKELPDKNADGTVITYRVEETVSSSAYTQDTTQSGYYKESDSWNFTNKHTPETTEVEGSKTWDDNDNQDGKRPSSITIYLYANGTKVDQKTVTAADNWSWKFTNLPKKANGSIINYTIVEDRVDGYEVPQVNGYNVTNTHNTEKISISGKKTWNDNNDQDGKRPESITVRLYKTVDDVKTEVTHKTVTAADKWEYTFADYPKYEGGKLITYSVSEDPVTDYTSSVDGYNLTNNHTPEKTSVQGSKKWEDAENQDGKRPTSIIINLLKNGTKVDQKIVTASADGTWTWEFTDLAKYEGGEEIKYTFSEEKITTADYQTSYNNDTGVITNTLTPESTNVSGSKTWNDNKNQDGKRPESITIYLYANGTQVKQTTVRAKDNWSWSFNDLPKYNGGKEIVYTIGEEPVSGYTTEVKGFNVTNTHNPETTTINGSKTWNDNNNQDGKRPSEIVVNLYKSVDGGTPVFVTSKTVTASNGWKWEFTDQPVYEDGKRITYSITEDEIPGYESEVKGYNVTNTHTPEKININGEKEWDDAENQDGKRPAYITVNLLANGKITDSKDVYPDEDGDWSFSFENLDKFIGGEEISYSISETPVTNYSTVVTGNVTDGFNVKNSYTPKKTRIEGEKHWEDSNNQDGKRPSSIDVILLADGTQRDRKTVTAENNWKYSFENLDLYKQGKEIKYTIKEVVNNNPGYTQKSADGYDLINCYTPETTEVSGVKNWDDNNDQDGIRPESIKVTLYADGKPVDEVNVSPDAEGNWKYEFKNLDKYANGNMIEYTVDESAVAGYSKNITKNTDGNFIITNKHTPEKTSKKGIKTWADSNNQDGKRPSSIIIHLMNGEKEVAKKTVTPDADGNWSWEFTNLDKYENGKEIVYTVKEDTIEGYTTTYSGMNVTNSYKPGKVAVSGNKVWDDASNQDGVRPTNITVELYADYQPDKALKTLSVTAGEDGLWNWSFDDLDEFKDGQKIVYSVKEIQVPGYDTPVISGSDNKYTITNKRTPDTVEVSGKKTWVDADNQDGKRPSSITVNLYSDGTFKLSKVVTPDANGNWSYTFSDLPKYSNGKEIKYTVDENPVGNGYEATVSGYNITNSRTPETTELNGVKEWKDNNDQDGIRPASVTVRLYADGTEVANQVRVVNAAGNWSYSFTNLPKYKEGALIAYTVIEDPVKGYESDVTNPKKVINTHEPEKTQVDVTKTWVDNDDQDGLRRDIEYIEFTLYADGEEVETRKAYAASNWSCSFTDLPKYKEGEQITYTVEETSVEGYSTTKSGYNFTNTHTTETVDLKGTKSWNDNNDQDGKRPAVIRVTLYADGVAVPNSEIKVTEADGWSYSWIGLPKYNDGKEIAYTITEENVAEYSTDISGNGSEADPFVITNSYTPGETQITVTKIWDDNDNQDGLRNEDTSVKVRLNPSIASAVSSRSDVQVTLNEDNNWTYTWNKLPKMQNKSTVTYSVEEIDVPAGYTDTYTGIGTQNITIKNTHSPEQTSVTGKKVWNDNEDQDGIRPQKITVNLMKNGAVFKTTTAEAPGWTYAFNDLDVYDDGVKNVYTVDEVLPEDSGYSKEVKGNDIYNTHISEKIEVSVEKNWNDNNNQDGERPESIIVRLMRDGAELYTKTLSKDAGWSCSWTGLPKYHNNGQEYLYTVVEDSVEGYSTKYNITNPSENTIKVEVTNTHTPGETSVGVTKVWNDNNNQDGLQPEEITVVLKANNKVEDTVTLNAKNSWTYNWTKLDEKRNGQTVNWTVEEINVPDGYSVEVSGSKTMYTLTNSHTTATTEVFGTKVWDDASNQDGKRPSTVTIRLWADGVDTGKTQTISGTDKSDSQTFRFTGLPKYRDGGELIVYTVTEVDSADLSSYKCAITGTANDGFTVTNKHVPELTSLNGEKIWNDNDDQDGSRPQSIVVNLLADGVKVEGKSLTVTANENWLYSFSDLPMYKDGKLIKYTVSEDAISGSTISGESYSTTYPGNNIKNSYTPGKTSVSVEKIWDDATNQDGIRTQAVTVRLVATTEDGQDAPTALYGVQATVELNAANDWSATWDGLPIMQNKKAILYTVVEDNVPAGYSSKISGTPDQYYVTNTHAPEKTSISGTKTWNDKDNKDGFRPDSIKVHLWADNVEIDSKDVTASDGWAYCFDNLPKYRDSGIAIVYKVTEDPVKEYSTVITETKTGFDIENKHIPETTRMTGTKVWDDADNQDGKRPEVIEVNLLADGEVVDSQNVTADEKGDWSWKFENLPVYRDGRVGEKIEYSFTETPVNNYSTIVDGTVIKNSYTPGVKNVSVSKTWDDASNQDGKRPGEIVVTLSAKNSDTALNGRLDTEVTLNASNSWSYVWEGLPEKQNGVTVEYSVDETSALPEGYSKSVSSDDGYSFFITNSYKPELTQVEGTKTWDDADNQDGFRPASITVRLSKTVGNVTTEIDHREVTAGNGWNYSFTDLPVYEDGQKIVYSLSEEVVDKYETTWADYDVTNTHKPELISVDGEKVWNDNDDQDGIRDSKVVVINLLANGEPCGEPLTLTGDPDWSYSFTNLPKYKNGEEIKYTVTENVISDYSTSINGYTVTNSYTPGETSVSVLKVWDDNKDQDNLRPGNITVTLSADVEGALEENGILTTVTLSDTNGWYYEWKGLPAKWNKQTVNYKVDETEVPTGYQKTIDDSNSSAVVITNKHVPELTSVNGEKIWNDRGNQDGYRPAEITVKLFADGVEYATTSALVSVDDSTWTYSFENLPKYKHGQTDPIVYTVDEVLPYGYEKLVEGYKITNTHAPELIDVDGKKTWEFNSDLYTAEDELAARPDSIEITLMAKTKSQEPYIAVDQNGNEIAPVNVTAADNWAWSFKDLPKFKDGLEIEYFVTEGEIDLYKTTLDGMDVTNTYMPGEKTVTVTKEWADNDNQDGGRPKGVVVQLYRDGFVDVKFGGEVVLDESNDWHYEWTALPKNKTLMGEYEYTVKEMFVIDENGNRIKVNKDAFTANERDYTVSIVESNGDFIITNSHEEITTTIKGSKFWDDNHDEFGNRPSSIQVIIKKGDLEVDRITLTGDRADDDWAWESKELPMYEDGEPICYTAEEYLTADDLYYYPAEEAKTIRVRKDGTQVEEGEDTSDEAFYEYLFCNTHDPMGIKIEGHKEWLPGDFTEEEMRDAMPDYIDLELWGRTPTLGEFRVTVDTNGDELPNKGTARVYPDENGDWSWAFENLIERRFRENVTYFVKETPVKDFSTYPVEGDEMSLQNKYTPETKELKVVKAWDDADNQDGVRPVAVTVQLYRGIMAYGDPIVLNEENNWTGVWKNIPVRSFASYSVKEISVTNADGTNHDIATDVFKLGVCEYQITVTENGDQFTVTNSHKPLTTIISGEKTWDDGGIESRRPSSIKIRLYADGVEVDSKSVTARDGWKWSFTDLPLNRTGKIAEPIEYTISEDSVPNYTTSVNGFNVRNSYNTPPTPPGETPPPSEPPVYTPPVTPSPTPTPEPEPPVLGARRGPGGSVLGAKRSMQPAVLGKRRRPTTGDSLAIFYYMAGFVGSLSGAITSGVKLKKTRKEDE